ncbi:MAG: AraC family transcriptional regulator [Chitinophagaceae bacterium]
MTGQPTLQQKQKMEQNIRLYNQNKIAGIIHYIEQNLESDLNVKKLADLSFNAYDRFHHLFTAVAGEAVHQHIKRVRMEKAVFHLRYTNFSIGDIAFTVGFGSNASFSKAFTSFFGKSPREFRTTKKFEKSFLKGQWLKNKLSPQITREAPKEMIFFRTYQLINIPSTWQKLFALQKTLELLAERPVSSFSLSNTELIFKTPDFPDITDIELCRWDIGLAADTSILQKLLELDEDEHLRKQTIPAGKYVNFIHEGPAIGIMDSYDTILNHLLPELNYQLAHSFTYHKYHTIDLQNNSRASLYFPVH